MKRVSSPSNKTGCGSAAGNKFAMSGRLGNGLSGLQARGWFFLPVFLFWGFFLAGGADSHGISFAFANKSLKKALALLISDHQVPILYQSRQLRGLKISAKCLECSPETALDLLLKQTPLTWEKVGDQYVLLQKISKKGKIAGTVRLMQGHTSFPGVDVVLTREVADLRSIHRSVTGPNGRFLFSDLDPGLYDLEFYSEGYLEQKMTGIRLEGEETCDLDVFIEDVTMPLQEMVVPSKANLHRVKTFDPQHISKEQIQNMPRFGNDLYRSMDHLPGISTGDLTSTFRVRGGDVDDTLFLFDGAEIDEPFHLKAVFSGLFSIIDAESIGEAELLAGGVPIEYGNNSAGVFKVVSADPSEQKTTLGLTTLGVKLKTEGRFSEGRGAYTLASREGFFNDDTLLTEFVESDRGPHIDSNVDYNDTFAKVSYQFNESHQLTVNTLVATDGAILEESTERVEVEGEGVIKTDSDNYMAWIRLQSRWTTNLTSQTVASLGNLNRRSIGKDSLGDRRYELSDDRRYERIGIRQDWVYNAGKAHQLKWGLSGKRARAELAYQNRREHLDSFLDGFNEGAFQREADTSTFDFGLYLADRIQLSPLAKLDFGVRYDGQSHTGTHQWGPRIQFILAKNSDRIFKLGWGRLSQPQPLYQLQVEDDVGVYFPPELAEHFNLSLENQFLNGMRFRAELYTKRFSNLRPRFINFLDPLSHFPETQADRLRIDPESGRASGLELTLSHRFSPRISWMANYTLSEVYDLVDGREVPRQWDQRHALNMAFNYRQNDLWNLNMAWHYHTGWRTTEIGFYATEIRQGQWHVTPQIGPIYGSYFPDYHRMDVRYNRAILDNRRHNLSLFVEITNLYNRRNIQSYGDHQVILGSTAPTLNFDSDRWVPQLSTFGVNWRF